MLIAKHTQPQTTDLFPYPLGAGLAAVEGRTQKQKTKKIEKTKQNEITNFCLPMLSSKTKSSLFYDNHLYTKTFVAESGEEAQRALPRSYPRNTRTTYTLQKNANHTHAHQHNLRWPGHLVPLPTTPIPRQVHSKEPSKLLHVAPAAHWLGLVHSSTSTRT